MQRKIKYTVCRTMNETGKYIKLEVIKAQGDKAHLFSHADCVCAVFVFATCVKGGGSGC